ncbi:uncharacterized protein BDCG_00757 [Blastomyces dermatitidis ER-3]|uniref:Uncharacterized protein n=2 Tax=Ajellomyces dermatitidis TaxID=5039 RepID=F2TJL4_AJEDA|nr:uncharacterized protein BDCG_00757 [Blastomyces dermatitidis ER-3]EEQ83952.2 hypothetical protein BDCG_00757 [Blastomyces dermatitidis ER-3]EGE83427.2 hypothetical protein BDDG_06371 [Blastomyces dermatitidis ATCC 18188]
MGMQWTTEHTALGSSPNPVGGYEESLDFSTHWTMDHFRILADYFGMFNLRWWREPPVSLRSHTVQKTKLKPYKTVTIFNAASEEVVNQILKMFPFRCDMLIPRVSYIPWTWPSFSSIYLPPSTIIETNNPVRFGLE